MSLAFVIEIKHIVTQSTSDAKYGCLKMLNEFNLLTVGMPDTKMMCICQQLVQDMAKYRIIII
jgi:hypothetical protein